MGIFDRLKEGILKVRVVPKQEPEDKTTFTPERDSVGAKINDAIDTGKRIDLSDFLKVTTLKGNRNQKYAAFEEMASDGRIGAALEMYANDTVQYNPEGKVVWVESSDSEVAKYCNKLIEDLNIEKNIWSWAYCLWLYGDVYIETFLNTSVGKNKPSLLVEPVTNNPQYRTQVDIAGAKLERYIEKVPNPAEIYDLQYKGKTAGYVRNKDTIDNTLEDRTYLYSGNATDINILNPTKFVHICLSPNINRFPEKFRIIKDDVEKVDENGRIDASNLEGSGEGLSFVIGLGQSVLENVYSAYQSLKLKEDAVTLERITKSSITRVIQVELGDLPESQKKRKLRELKNQIEQQQILNKEAGTLQSRAGAQPIENIIYTTTKNGKGAISSINIGGDVNIGDLADLEDSENKLYGSLLIPKGLLGANMESSGLSNGGSLTEMNTTYARRIKRGQLALINGIETLINIFALSEGLGEKMIGKFQVRLTPIITIEDNRRDELLSTKIRNVNDILALTNGMNKVSEDLRLKLLIEWLSKYLNQQDIVDIINDYIKELEQEESEDETLNNTTDEDSDIQFKGGNAPTGSTGFNPPLDRPSETEEPKSNLETNTEPELAPQTDLADIEGEDLV